VRDRVAEIPGVARVEARVVADVTLDVPGLSEPASGRLIGIDIPPRPMLNDVFLAIASRSVSSSGARKTW
jgi:putative ABC transport system permease protein